MKTIALTVRHSLSGELKGEFLKIIGQLQKSGKNIVLTPNAKRLVRNEEKHSALPELSKENISEVDLFLFFGGDGTLLRTIHNFAPEIFYIPIFGINAGNVGFFSSISPVETKEAFPLLFAGNSSNDSRMIAKGTVLDANGNEKKSFYALNEITIHHSGIARLRKMRVSISEEFLTTFSADGLIIATPTGSTAYNLAAGGPIVSPQIDAFTLTPLAPSGFSQRSIVLPAHKSFTIKPDAEMNISIDGQEYFSLAKDETLSVIQYSQKLCFLRMENENYYKNLREKLGWGQ